jgi:hypothetical protein
MGAIDKTLPRTGGLSASAQPPPATAFRSSLSCRPLCLFQLCSDSSQTFHAAASRFLVQSSLPPIASHSILMTSSPDPNEEILRTTDLLYCSPPFSAIFDPLNCWSNAFDRRHRAHVGRLDSDPIPTYDPIRENSQKADRQNGKKCGENAEMDRAETRTQSVLGIDNRPQQQETHYSYARERRRLGIPPVLERDAAWDG